MGLAESACSVNTVLQTEAAGRRLAGGGVSAASLGCLGELLVMGLVEI